jgi:hypothetical protein
MAWTKYTYVLQFINGEIETFDYVGGCTKPEEIVDGVLTLWVQDGEYADRKPLGSFPLVNLLRWKPEKVC